MVMYGALARPHKCVQIYHGPPRLFGLFTCTKVRHLYIIQGRHLYSFNALCIIFFCLYCSATTISDKLVSLGYTVKNVSDFPVPSRDVTNQTLPGRE